MGLKAVVVRTYDVTSGASWSVKGGPKEHVHVCMMERTRSFGRDEISGYYP